MKTTAQTFTNLLIQLLSIVLLSLYLYVTHNAYTLNYIWFAAALLLGLAGFFLRSLKALAIAFVVVLTYGGITLYEVSTNATDGAADTVMEWNDVIWLFAFPLFSLIGGLLSKKNQIQANLRADYKGVAAMEQGEEDELDDSPFDGYMGLSRFLEQQRERVDNKLPFSVLLVQIENLQELEKQNGTEKMRLFLIKIAELINETAHEAEAKSYLEDGLFGLILAAENPIAMSNLKKLLSEEFNLLLLSRARREGKINLNLVFGSSDSPWQGKDVMDLMTTAREELKYSSSY